MDTNLIKHIIKLTVTECFNIYTRLVILLLILSLQVASLLNSLGLFSGINELLISDCYIFCISFILFNIVYLVRSYKLSVRANSKFSLNEYDNIVADKLGLTNVCLSFPFLSSEDYIMFGDDILESYQDRLIILPKSRKAEVMQNLNTITAFDIQYTLDVPTHCLVVSDKKVYANPSLLYRSNMVLSSDIVCTILNSLKISEITDSIIFTALHSLECSLIEYNSDKYLYVKNTTYSNMPIVINTTKSKLEKDTKIISALQAKSELLNFA